MLNAAGTDTTSAQPFLLCVCVSLICQSVLTLLLLLLLHSSLSPLQARQTTQEDKAKWRFMQKYWHKGAFFQVCGDGCAGGVMIDVSTAMLLLSLLQQCVDMLVWVR